MIVNKKRRLPNYGLAVQANYRVKLKERKKKDKYLDLGRELNNTMKRENGVILTVFGALDTVTKRFFRDWMTLK